MEELCSSETSVFTRATWCNIPEYGIHRWRDCSQIIHPGWPKSQFCLLPWYFMVIAWKCSKNSLRTLATKEFAVPSRQRTFWHFPSSLGILFTKNSMPVKDVVIWDVTPCGSNKSNRCFGRTIASVFKLRRFWFFPARSEDIPHDGRRREPLVTAFPQPCLSVTLELPLL
jgi:hypothetical protein